MNSKPPGASPPPEMEPEQVVREAFRRLGKTSFMVPGMVNKIAVLSLGRLIGRKGATNIVAKNMVKLYRPDTTKK
jgi:hypothetical protein